MFYSFNFVVLFYKNNKMKKLFKKKKRSVSEVGSLASLSHSGYDISPKKDLTKLHKAAYEGDLTKLKSLLKKADVNELDKEKRYLLFVRIVKNC